MIIESELNKVFLDILWINSILCNGYINHNEVEKLKKNLAEVSWQQMVFNSSLYRSDFNPPESFGTTLAWFTVPCEQSLFDLPELGRSKRLCSQGRFTEVHRDDCCVCPALVLNIWSFYTRCWEFFFEFFSWQTCLKSLSKAVLEFTLDK